MEWIAHYRVTPKRIKVHMKRRDFIEPIDYYIDEAYNMFHYGYEHMTSYSVPKIRSIMHSLYILYLAWKKDKEDYYKKASQNVKIISERYSKEVVSSCMENFLNDSGKFSPDEVNDQKLMDYWNSQYKGVVG